MAGLFGMASSMLFSQDVSYKYWIEFSTAKDLGYSIYHPEEFLSDRAIQRRQNQGIPIEDNDLPVSRAISDSLVSMGLKVLHTSKWFNAAAVETTDSLLADKLSEKTYISSIELVYHYPVAGVNLSSIPENSGSESGLVYGDSQRQISIMNGDYLHEQRLQGQGMIIAVLDGGFYRVDSLSAFDSLRANGQILAYRDFVDPEADFFTQSAHGMSVLSLMGGNIPGTLIGTAPQASYLLLRTEDVRTESRIEEINWLVAAEFADSAGADIINSSVGYSWFDDPTLSYSYQNMDGRTTLVTRAANLAAEKGILVVNSAGNHGAQPWRYIISPADGEGVLAVGAVDTNGIIAGFSSYGPTYDQRVKPNTLAVGYQALVFRTYNSTGRGNGTSYSSPLIAGMAACLWQKYPLITNYEIKESIEQSSDKYHSPYNQYGYGIPNFIIAESIISGIYNEKIQNPFEVEVFPNPCIDFLNIKIVSAIPGTAAIKFYDLSGKLVLSVERPVSASGIILINDLGQLQPGFYLIDVETGIIHRRIKMLKM